LDVLQIGRLIRNFKRKSILFVLVPAFFAALALGCQSRSPGNGEGGPAIGKKKPVPGNSADSGADGESKGNADWEGAPSTSYPGTIPPVSLGVPGNARFQVADYGDALRTNKRLLKAALVAAQASPAETALIVAIAMQESTYMSSKEIDRSKDGTSSANVSILNLNYDMLVQLGYPNKDFGVPLNEPAALKDAALYLVRTLNFHRGGRTAFNDGQSFGAAEYRNSIATIYAQIAKDPTLLDDGRRIEVDVPHV
jgi:hypothetical protein